MFDLLCDEHRAVPKPKFIPEQMARVIAVATEKPEAKDTDPVGFARDVRAVCDTYAGATMAHMRGEHVMSTDEKTGIQALERVAPTKPAVPGKIESVGL